MSAWDEPIADTIPQAQDTPDNKPDTGEKLLELMKEYKTTQSLIDDLKEKADLVKEEILHHFPNEPGRYDHFSQNLLLEVTISEKWTWDDRKLEEIIDEKELPLYVKRKLSIDRRKFCRLEEQERDLYLDALTREPGVARVRVKELPREDQQG